MADITFSYPALHEFCVAAFQRFGFDRTQSIVIAESLLLADIYGIESHGIQRISRYHKSIVKGEIRVEAESEIIKETPISAVVDGHDGMGQLIAYDAMKVAIRKAKESGIGIVLAKNSNHYGIAGYYAKMACGEGLIGISMTNTAPLMVPTFGAKSMLGTNPLAVCVPAEPYPFFFDAATTVATRGKVEVYNKKEQPMPQDWAVDAEGRVSTDAARIVADLTAKQGGLLPLGGAGETMGGHKGYGLAMIVEIFTGMLALAEPSAHTYEGGRSRLTHSFVALDPAIFGDAAAIRAHLSHYLEELRQSPKAEGQTRIYTHGEKEAIALRDRMQNGIAVNEKTVREMREMAEYLGMDIADYLGKEALV